MWVDAMIFINSVLLLVMGNSKLINDKSYNIVSWKLAKVKSTINNFHVPMSYNFVNVKVVNQMLTIIQYIVACWGGGVSSKNTLADKRTTWAKNFMVRWQPLMIWGGGPEEIEKRKFKAFLQEKEFGRAFSRKKNSQRQSQGKKFISDFSSAPQIINCQPRRLSSA